MFVIVPVTHLHCTGSLCQLIVSGPVDCQWRCLTPHVSRLTRLRRWRAAAIMPQLWQPGLSASLLTQLSLSMLRNTHFAGI